MLICFLQSQIFRLVLIRTWGKWFSGSRAPSGLRDNDAVLWCRSRVFPKASPVWNEAGWPGRCTHQPVSALPRGRADSLLGVGAGWSRSPGMCQERRVSLSSCSPLSLLPGCHEGSCFPLPGHCTILPAHSELPTTDRNSGVWMQISRRGSAFMRQSESFLKLKVQSSLPEILGLGLWLRGGTYLPALQRPWVCSPEHP